MTEVAEHPPPTEQACPHCGAQLAPDQEWCLNCGTDVGSRIAPTPRWRLPLFLVGALFTLIVVALVLALVELSGDPQPVAKAPSATATATPAGAPADDGGAAPPVAGATPTPAPTTATPSVTPAPSTTPDAGATPQGPASTTGALATWPSGKSGWTAVLASTKSRSEAERKARAAGSSGAGVLHSDDFSSLRKGYWVVFSGQFDSQKAAESAAKSAGGGAYSRQIVPR